MATPRPGTSVVTRETPQPRNAPTDTGVWFACGLSDRGPAVPTLIQSLSDFITKFGNRVSYSILYDAVETYFREGGSKAYISRVLGPAPVIAFKNFLDNAAATSLIIQAKNAGDWGNNLRVAISVGSVGGTFVITVTDVTDATVNEVSGDLADTAAAVAYGQQSQYINIVQGASTNDPVPIAAQALATGTDDRTNATDTQWQAALDKFTRDLGPGQVSYPGRTTTTAHTQLQAHAAAQGRVALMDSADTVTVATLTTEAVALRALSTHRYGAIFAPWVIIPGILPNTTRTVPPSALAAGLMSRSDAAGNSPNVPAAGANGQAVYAVGLSQAAWTDTQRDTLNTAGVDVFRIIYGGVRLYGYRTLTDPVNDANWINLANVRLFMAIQAKGGEIAERYVLAQLDGQRRKIAQYGGELAGMLLPYYEAGSLYGATPQEAFNVNVGPQVNTDSTIADGQLKAVISLKMSPFAELVVLELVKTRVTEAVS